MHEASLAARTRAQGSVLRGNARAADPPYRRNGIRYSRAGGPLGTVLISCAYNLTTRRPCQPIPRRKGDLAGVYGGYHLCGNSPRGRNAYRMSSSSAGSGGSS